jgi:hypothetical protein
MPNSRARAAFFSPLATRALSSITRSVVNKKFAALVNARLLRNGDSFALAFLDQRPLELSERAHDAQE